jgi:signal transduction histidine kinase
LCEAERANLWRPDGEGFKVAAMFGQSPADKAALRQRVVKPGRDTCAGRALLEGRTVRIEDAKADPEYNVPDVLKVAGQRAMIGVPLLREDTPIGVLVLTRTVARPFTEKQIALATTFADQAVIAIENVRLFREIQDKSAQLELASQHKSEFLANMSHELRTPLNAIIGFSEVLAERMFGEVNDKQAEYLADILESGRHLLSLINDILDLSKIEAGRMELEPTDFSLPGAIDNALKFTPEGGRIDVRAAVRDREVETSVTDTGVGIAAEDQATVFEEFRQVGSAARKVEGTGLGLAISRKFIELHGGRIWVTSQEGIGSTFAFTLPLTGTQGPMPPT